MEGFKKHICLKEKYGAKLEFPEGWRGEFKLKTFLGGYGYYCICLWINTLSYSDPVQLFTCNVWKIINNRSINAVKFREHTCNATNLFLANYSEIWINSEK